MATQYQQQPGPQPDGGNMGGNEPRPNDDRTRTSTPLPGTGGKRSGDAQQSEDDIHRVRNNEQEESGKNNPRTAGEDADEG